MTEKAIWDYLLNKLHNTKGVAAMMGNLMAESSMNPKCVTGIKKTGMTVDEYIKASDEGKHDFVNDSVTFGLVQWCFKTRKEGLLNKAKSCNSSVADTLTQLQYLLDELPKYKTAYNAVINGTDIAEITKTVMLKYEKPGNTGEAAQQKRINYAKSYYNRYASDNISVRCSHNVWEAFYASLQSEFE